MIGACNLQRVSSGNGAGVIGIPCPIMQETTCRAGGSIADAKFIVPHQTRVVESLGGYGHCKYIGIGHTDGMDGAASRVEW